MAKIVLRFDCQIKRMRHYILFRVLSCFMFVFKNIFSFADCRLRFTWWMMNNEGFSVFSAMPLADAVYRNRATMYIKTDKNQQEERIPTSS